MNDFIINFPYISYIILTQPKMISTPFNFQKQSQLTQNDCFISNLYYYVDKDLKKNQTKITYSHLQKPIIPEQSKLHRKILDGKFFSKNNRVKLRNWVYKLCSQMKLSHNIAPLLCFYIDLCQSKGMNIKLKDMQEFAIACLLIAAKLHEHIGPLLDLSSYDIKKILSFEEQIVLKLQFKLHRITYIEISEEIIRLWAAFQSASMTFEQSQTSHEGTYAMLVVFTNCLYKQFPKLLLFEFLQYAFHFIQTLDINMEWFVFNAFYFILCTQLYGVTGPVSQQHFKHYYSADSQLNQIIKVFTNFCHIHKYDLLLIHDEGIQAYLRLIYNSLIQGFDLSIYQKSKIAQFDPDDWMPDQKSDCWKQTHFFVSKEESYFQIENHISAWVAEMTQQKKYPSLISTTDQQQILAQSQTQMNMQI